MVIALLTLPAAQLAELKTRKFMIFHPAWTYFANDYDLLTFRTIVRM
jgi:ABC-type Zn2+ transport system substrate-binding protein/surface adhesin